MTDNPDPEVARPVRAGYDRWAAVYDHDANPLQALEGPHVRSGRGGRGNRLGGGRGRAGLARDDLGQELQLLLAPRQLAVELRHLAFELGDP